MNEEALTTEHVRQTFAYVQAGLDDDDGYPFVMHIHVDAFDAWLDGVKRDAAAVDVVGLAKELGRHKLVHVAVSREGAFCMCNSSVKAGTRDNLAWFAEHRALAVSEWLKGADQ